MASKQASKREKRKKVSGDWLMAHMTGKILFVALTNTHTHTISSLSLSLNSTRTPTLSLTHTVIYTHGQIKMYSKRCGAYLALLSPQIKQLSHLTFSPTYNSPFQSP